jgi:hypothetical protein
VSDNEKGLIAGVVVAVVFIVASFLPAVLDKRLVKRVELLEERVKELEVGSE